MQYLEITSDKYPDKIALVDNKRKLTFSQLRCEARKLATVIGTSLTSRRRPILVYLPKSATELEVFFGILYSGNFYTPVDVRYPIEKVRRIIEQLRPALFISDTKHFNVLLDLGINERGIILWDKLIFSNIKPADRLSEIINTDLAYVLFTSGSTGLPKGVAIRQCSVIDYIDWAAQAFGVDVNDVILNQAPFVFDNSILDIYLCIKTGATLHIVPESLYVFGLEVLEYIALNKITQIFWVPSALIRVANQHGLEQVDCSCLKRVLFCGEVMPNRQLNYWRRHLPACQYANLYGPTEITDACTYFVVNRGFSDDEPLPIGNACLNTEALIFTEDDLLVTAPNVTGELCIRGICLAAGYWNDPKKTAEVFTQNPLCPDLPDMIYHTGDLVHYNERHEIIYEGRRDFQIKHFGYRIELGEIETAAGGVEGLDNVCCVYDRQHDEIVLFYQSLKHLSGNEIRKKLSKSLPRAFVPVKYIDINEFPYNDNGKIDRKKLGELLSAEKD